MRSPVGVHTASPLSADSGICASFVHRAALTTAPPWSSNPAHLQIQGPCLSSGQSASHRSSHGSPCCRPSLVQGNLHTGTSSIFLTKVGSNPVTSCAYNHQQLHWGWRGKSLSSAQCCDFIRPHVLLLVSFPIITPQFTHQVPPAVTINLSGAGFDRQRCQH